MPFLYELLTLTNSIYSLVLILCGTIANILSFIICLSQEFKNLPTFIFFMFILINDTFGMYGTSINTFLHITSIRIFNQFEVCILILFTQSFTLQWTAWCWVLMTLERLLKISGNKRIHDKLFNPKNSVRIAFAIGFMLFTLNLIFSVTFNRQHEIQKCVKMADFYTWAKVHTFLNSLIPILIISVSNIIILILLKRKYNQISDATIGSLVKEKLQSCAYVLVLSSLFTIFTLQNTLCILFSDRILAIPYGNIYLNISECIQFTFCSSNILILVLNKKFRKKLKNTFFLL